MTIEHQRIQERAYALWVDEGRAHGRADDYWLRAERELNYVGRTTPVEANENQAAKKAAVKRRASGKRAA
jgi:hypothetical protein